MGCLPSDEILGSRLEGLRHVVWDVEGVSPIEDFLLTVRRNVRWITTGVFERTYVSAGSSAQNGGHPITDSYMMAPRDHQSQL